MARLRATMPSVQLRLLGSPLPPPPAVPIPPACRRLGDLQAALTLILRDLRDVREAVAFVLEHRGQALVGPTVGAAP